MRHNASERINHPPSGAPKTKAVHAAFYGNVVIQRGYCSDCESYAFITDGKYACCNKPCEDELRAKRRMVECAVVKTRPNATEQAEILRHQHQRCFYCERFFGATVYRKAREIVLRIDWDHVIPWIYGLDNRKQNFVAACHVCNRLKAAVMFNSIDDARVFLREKWKAKGYAETAPVLELRRDV